MKIQIINGPNINLLGKREPSIYGSQSFESYLEKLKEYYPQVEFAYFQSNIEGEMINKIHEVGFDWDGIILNAGAYTHTSLALQDAIRAVKVPVIEVHISNVHALGGRGISKVVRRLLMNMLKESMFVIWIIN